MRGTVEFQKTAADLFLNGLELTEQGLAGASTFGQRGLESRQQQFANGAAASGPWGNAQGPTRQSQTQAQQPPSQLAVGQRQQPRPPQPSNWTPPASVYGQQPSPAPHNHRERGPASRPRLRRHDSSPGPPASRRPAGVAPSTGSPRPRARNRRPRTRDVPGRRRPSGGSDVSTARVRTWTSREVSARYRTLRWVIAFPGPFQHRQLRSAIPAR